MYAISGVSTNSGAIPINANEPVMLAATITSHAVSGNPQSDIIVDGQLCSADRGYSVAGNHAYANASCSRLLTPGPHTVQLYCHTCNDAWWDIQVVD